MFDTTPRNDPTQDVMRQDIGDSPDVDVTGLTSLNLVEREPNEKSYFAATFTDAPDLIAAID